MSPFANWESFYAILGSAAATLTGLQFVVMALIVNLEMRAGTLEIDAFSTPTIVHFGAVLILSAIATAPWHGSLWPALLLFTGGATGVSYSSLTALRARRQTTYVLVAEDWTFYVALPATAYGAIAVAAAVIGDWPPGSRPALFVIATASVALLCIAIHNAWDAVIYIVFSARRGDGTP